MEQTVQKEEDSISIDSLVRRKEGEKEVNSGKWSEVVLEDVGIYEGYEFAQVDSGDDKPSYSKKTICKTGNPKEVLSQLKSSNNTLPELDDLNNTLSRRKSGSFMHGTRKVQYARITRTIAKIRVPSSGHTKKVLIKNGTETTNQVKQELKDRIGQSVLIGTNESEDSLIRTDDMELKGEEVPNPTKTNNIKSLLSASMLFVGFTGLFSLPVGLIAFGLALSVSSVYHAKVGSLDDNTFQYKSPSWLDDVSENARVEKVSHGTKEVTSEVQIEEGEFIGKSDGSVVVKTADATWTFNGNNGLPNDDAVELYEEYCSDSPEDVNLIVSETNGGFSSSEVFESDCGEYYLIKDAY